MAADEASGAKPARSLPWPVQAVGVLLLCGVAGAAVVIGKARSGSETTPPPAASTAGQPFRPSAAQLATFTIKPVEERAFQVEYATEGKIAVDEDRTTPIFSQYPGRVIRLVAKPGETVKAGQVLFTIEAADMVQAQNDLLTASGVGNKARSQLALARIVEKRQHDLFDSKAGSLKDWQSAQNDLTTAQNDLRASEAGIEAVRNRLVILGKSPDEITAFLGSGRMSPESPVVSPIAGTVTQRKVGPGQFISSSATDPAYVIGDLSHVWLLANVREADAPFIVPGQAIRFRVLSYPDRVFEARADYVAAALDPSSRRITVRSNIDNPDGLLKPEMFASIRISSGRVQTSPAVPREAVIYEADKARVWVVAPDGTVALRPVTTGLLVDGSMIQVTSGLAVGEKVVTRGSLFIDRLAAGDVT